MRQVGEIYVPAIQTLNEALLKGIALGTWVAIFRDQKRVAGTGKTIDEALAIKNTEIVKELALPPVKIHCSVLAEDAIRAAIGDWKKKQEAAKPVAVQAAQ